MNAKKLTLLFGFAVLLVVALSACGGGAAPAASTCTDKIGCVTVGANDPVHIAYFMVVAGDNANLGIDPRNGAEIAIDDHGGKVAGHAIKFDGQDAGCGPEGGQAAAAKLAADNTIVAILGSACSSEWTAGGPTLSKAGFLAISPAATSPVLTDPAKRKDWPTFFRTAHNDKVQGAVAAQFVFTQLKITTVAGIHDGGPYTQGLVNAFADAYTKLGGKMTSTEAVTVGAKDMKPLLTKIASDKPGLIFYPIFLPEGGLITAQIGSVPGLENTKQMTADGLFNPDWLKAAGQAGVGVYQSSPDFSAFGSDYKDKFLPAYQKKFNMKPPTTYHAHAYDAMNIIFAAIEAVAQKDADGTLHIGRQALVDYVAALKNFKGLTGNLTCDANGDCADPHIAVYQETADNVAKDAVPTTPIWKP